MSITFALICAGFGFAIAGGFAVIMAWLQPTALALEIEQSIRAEPKRWGHGGSSYRFKRDDGLELWIGNGCFSLEIYSPRKISLKWADKRLLWKAYSGRNQGITLADIMAKPA